MIYICSMNKKVFTDFGWRLIDSFQSHYKGSGCLIVYTEEMQFEELLSKFKFDSKVKTQLLGSSIYDFIKLASQSSRRKGKCWSLEFTKLRKVLALKSLPGIKLSNYNFLYDSVRFCFKSFCWSQAISECDDKIVYLDADCHFFNDFDDDNFWESISGDIGYFGRWNYTESGILLFDNRNFNLRDFGLAIQNTYTSGDIFKLKHWTDCHVFDDCREQFKEKLNFQNLTLGESPHPIAESYLSEFIDHRKGPRKPLEHSPELAK